MRARTTALRLCMRAPQHSTPLAPLPQHDREMSDNKTPLHAAVLAANATYASTFGAKASLALPPARKAAFLACMDARLDVAKVTGLSEGDAHVIRNAGGRASDDAIRSLVISHKLLGTNEWFVLHHTDCGMEVRGTRGCACLCV